MLNLSISRLCNGWQKTLCIALVCLLGMASLARAEADKPVCRYVNLKTLPVKLAEWRILVDGAINDHAVKLFVDTGAPTSALTRNGAEKLGLKLGHAALQPGAGGESRGYQALVDSIRVGPIQGKHIQLPVFWELSLEPDLDGLVGADFLFQHDLEMSLAEQQFKFFYMMNCKDDTFLAYWDPDASVVPMYEWASTTGMRQEDAGRMVIVEVNGQKIRAKIDSGAPESRIDLLAAARAGVTTSSPGTVPAGKGGGVGTHQPDVWRAKFNTFSLGDETITDAHIMITDLWGPLEEDTHHADRSELPEMLLGLDFLRTHRVLFAINQNRFYFSYLGGKLFDGKNAKAPLSNTKPENSAPIKSPAPTSPGP